MIADCQLYGLLDGGPKINVARCDEILELGRQRGIHPSKNPRVLAVEFAVAINSTAGVQS